MINFLVYIYVLDWLQDYYLIEIVQQYFDQFFIDQNKLLIYQPFMTVNVKDNNS